MVKRHVLLRVIMVITSVMTIALGITVIFGWHTSNVTLVQINPAFVPMQYNTALCFFLSGLSILLIYKRLSLSGVFLCGLSGLTGLLTLLQYALGVNLGIDELIMDHYITTATSSPGRMAPNTALGFMMFSSGLLLTIGSTKQKRIAGVIASLLFGLGLAAFVGYLVGVEAAYGWGRLTHMAVHTAIGFVGLSTALTIVSWADEPLSALFRASPSNLWWVGYAATISLTIFLIDISLPLGLADGFLYVLFILFIGAFQYRRLIYYAAIISTILIIFGYIFSPEGLDTWIATANRVLSVIAIWVTAVLLSQIKTKEAALRRINADMKVKNKELEQFVYIASHDLQEPMRTVSSLIDVLNKDYKDKLDETANKCLNFMSQASTQMQDLMKALLDYSRIGRNTKVSEVDCNELLQEIQLAMHQVIAKSEAQILCKDLPTILAHPMEMRIIFENLLANAIKFRSSERPPMIEVSGSREGDHYKFQVKDNGIGIEKEHQQRIFRIFQRLHSKSLYEGTGIGLAHCKKIVELHHGNIWFDSAPGQGTTFYFTIEIQSL